MKFGHGQRESGDSMKLGFGIPIGVYGIWWLWIHIYILNSLIKISYGFVVTVRLAWPMLVYEPNICECLFTWLITYWLHAYIHIYCDNIVWWWVRYTTIMDMICYDIVLVHQHGYDILWYGSGMMSIQIWFVVICVGYHIGIDII